MRRLRLVHGALLAAGGGLLAASGACSTPPLDTALRALEESGRISFVCLGDPEQGSPIYPLTRCRNVRADSACEFSSTGGAGGSTGGTAGTGGGAGEGGAGATGGAADNPCATGEESAPAGDTPHLYGLVTQTFRGEVAVIDMTTSGTDRIVDQDPTVPGPSFLPIGGQPVGIVSTPGGTATFVTVAEVGREGVFAVPSSRLLRKRRDPADPDRCTATWDGMPSPPRISSWPACSLPAAPGEPILVDDPVDDQGRERARCDDPYDAPACDGPNGSLAAEGHGRQKIVVPLPALGGIAVIDAQELLDRPDGSFDPCPIDRWVLLDDEVPPVAPPAPPKGPACTSLAPPEPTLATGAPVPSGMAFADGELYVSDLALPLVHRLVMGSPCEPVALPPLLPFSLDEPDRTVTTSRLAVTPRPTASLKRYLYANDVGDGTVMVFDVSDGATTRTPLVREHPEWTPLQPRDRLRFVSAPRDIAIVSRDVPFVTPGTGVATEGVFCDPDPSLPCCDATREECTASASDCVLSTQYRTAGDYTSGAGPYKLRGTFAFVLLTNGQVEIVDIEDLDGPCRVPSLPTPQGGCDVVSCVKDSDCPDQTVFQCSLGATPESPGFCERKLEDALLGSDEISCNVVTPNALRSSAYVLDDTTVGYHRPGLQTFPLLFDSKGSLLDTTDAAVPVMHATLPADGRSVVVSVGNQPEPASPEDGSPGGGIGHLLAMNEETPRAQTANQGWTVTFEGPLPRYGAVSAELRVKDDAGAPLPEPGIHDSNGLYCDAGVQSFQALREQLTPPGAPPTPAEQAEIDKQARLLADRVQIASALVDREDDYWEQAAAAPLACTYDECRAAFGDGDTLLPDRDFVIREAYQDRLILDDVVQDGEEGPVSLLGLAKCCFPSLVSYYVRPGNQWVVVGQGNGFMHHVLADPETGVCRPSCDPALARMNGRALRTPSSYRGQYDVVPPAYGKPVLDGSPTAFINQMFRFAIVDGSEPPQRDMQFRFTTAGSFSPLTVTLLNDTRDIAPVGITYVPPTGELAVTDGSLQGVIMVGLQNVQSSRQFY